MICICVDVYFSFLSLQEKSQPMTHRDVFSRHSKDMAELHKQWAMIPLTTVHPAIVQI